MVIMRWEGGAKNADPVAFVGKGVTFDTGGISIKPAAGMEDMKWDMGGSGVVIGLMKALAGRKAKVNVVGVVGLVENMPDGNAQRPGDIVTSMSGQTIEVINTDAEGRLVLADALHYTIDKYSPKFVVNLATLTGAIIISLGDEHAGLFSNNDTLSERLSKAGQAVDEKVWRLPISPAYLGAPGHRRRHLVEEGRRHRAEGRHRLWRALARPAGGGPLRRQVSRTPP
jgi:leucyl aminopeptidase